MTSANILDLPFRKSVSLELSSAIKAYISTKYDQHPDMFASDLATVDRIRSDAINVQEAHISGIQKLGRYAAQLQWMSGKFPIDIGADFSWYPALGYNTKTPVTQNNVQYERANIIFNLAALYSKLAAAAPRTTPEGLKNACNWFCAAAGALKYLKEDVLPELRSTPPEDMDVSTLGCLEQLMLAQAQECFWFKAVKDSSKDIVVARLAASVSDFYDTAGMLGVESDSITSEWMHHMTAKHHHFAAAAQYRMACYCLDKSKYGEEVARLQDSLDAVNDALKEGRYLNKTVVGDLMGLKEKISETLKGAEKDNNMIYLNPVPAASELTRITRAPMASSRVPPELVDGMSMLGENLPYGAPLFAKLVPFAVHVAASIYAERRDRLVNNNLIDELEVMTTKLHEFLQSVNLPGSLQALEKPLGLPPTLVAHAEEIQQQGGVEKLLASIEDIDKLKANDGALYQEAVEILKVEATEDEMARSKHGTDRWTRPPSKIAAKKLVDQVQEYGNILQSADNSDKLVRDKLKEFQPILKLLGGRIHDLEDFVPSSARPSLTAKMDREVGKLRQCLNEVSRLEARRRRRIEALRQKAKSDDITADILAEAGRIERENPLRKVEAADFEHFFITRLESKYKADKSILEAEAEEQAELIARLKEANSSFLASRRVDSSLKEREEALQKLETGYLKFWELMSNLDVGRKFYNDLARLLTRFNEECKHFVTQRRVEAGQIETDVSNTMRTLHLGGTPISSSLSQQQDGEVGRPMTNPPLPAPQPTRPSLPIPSPGLWTGDSTSTIRFSAPPSKPS